MLGSPFCIECCSLTVPNKRKARKDGFCPIATRYPRGVNRGRRSVHVSGEHTSVSCSPRAYSEQKTRAHPTSRTRPYKTNCFFQQRTSWQRRRLHVNKLEQKTWRVKPDGDLPDCGLRDPCMLQQRRLRHFFKNAFSISSWRMHLIISRTRVLAYSRLSAFGSGSPVSSFFCRSYGPPGKRERKWRTGNVAENLFDEPAIFGYITCQWLRE